MATMLIAGAKTVGFFDHLYYTQVNGYKVIYNPYSYKSPAVLPLHVYAFLKHLLNGRRTVEALAERAMKKKAFDSRKHFIELLNELNSYHLLSIGGERNHLHLNSLSDPKKASFWIDITNQCNFRCTYCYIDRKTEVLDSHKFGKMLNSIAQQLVDLPMEEIVFVLAGGEPLLYFDVLKGVIEEINEFRTKHKSIRKFKTIIITNGSLITEERARYFKKNRVEVAISLDGLGEYNDRTRQYVDGSGTFSSVMKGLRIAQNTGVLSNTITTVTSKNIHHLPELVDFILREDIGLQLQFYKKTTPFCLDEPVVFDTKAINSYLKAIRRLYEWYTLYPGRREKLVTFFNSVKFPIYTSEYGCAAGLNYFTITQNCELKVCPSSQIKIPFEKVPNFISVIRKKNEKFVAYSVESNPHCRKCLWKYSCKGGCKMELFVSGNLNDRPSVCPFFKKMIPFFVRLEAKSIILSQSYVKS